MKALAIVILMGLNLATALMLSSKMGQYYWIEALLIVIAMGVIGVQFLAMWLDAEWAYPLATILFSLGLVNFLWLYSSVGWFKVFAAGIVFNLLGIVISSIGSKKNDDSDELETYDDIDDDDKEDDEDDEDDDSDSDDAKVVSDSVVKKKSRRGRRKKKR